MKKIKIIGLILLATTLHTSCKTSTSPDVSHIQIDIKPQLFFVDLFNINPDSITQELPALKDKYGDFVDAYSIGVLKIGATTTPDYASLLKTFLEYDANKEVLATCKQQYTKVDDLAQELSMAFKHYNYYFPKKPIPAVYFHISGFNQSVIIDSGLVSVSIEKYLGSNCKFYEWLATPVYMRKGMVREKITPDVMRAIAMTDFSTKMKNDDLVNNMLLEAKSLYFTKRMMPELNDTLLFDYSAAQLKWCNKYESDLWAGLVERKDLFNTERMLIQKYVGDSPFTYYFGQESPGRVAVFLAYRMIEAYMDKNPQVTLSDLMNQEDGHLILSGSQYRP